MIFITATRPMGWFRRIRTCGPPKVNAAKWSMLLKNRRDLNGAALAPLLR